MELKNGDILTIEDRNHKTFHDCKIVIECNVIYICSNIRQLSGSKPKNPKLISPYSYCFWFSLVVNHKRNKRSKSHMIGNNLWLVERKKQEGLSLWF